MEEKLSALSKVLDEALNELYRNDKHLLDYKVNERAIVFRLGIYMQELMNKYGCFEGLNLDFEYNRNIYDAKRLPKWENGVYPDLIVHKRGANVFNLLVMEFKTYWNPNCTNDYKKIKEFVNPCGEYRYRCGKSILLGKERNEVCIETFFPKRILTKHRFHF